MSTYGNPEVTIDPEFRALCPPLSADERARLEANIIRDGCREPLVVWAGRGILLDGHNRHEICTWLNVRYQTTEQNHIETRDDAKVWIVGNQLGRRNLTTDQRVALAVIDAQLKSEIAKRERARTAGETGGMGRPKNSLSDNVSDKLFAGYPPSEMAFRCKCGEYFDKQVWHWWRSDG